MKIKFVKVKFGDEYSYKYLPFKYCCDKLKHNPLISLNDHEELQQDFCTYCEYHDQFGSEECQKCNAITPKYETEIPSFKQCHTVTYDDWGEEWENDYYIEVNFCPHCGEKLEYEVIDEVDMTEEYNELEKKRDKLWKKCRSTDSKKEEVELREKVSELDNLIDEFYGVSEFKGEKNCE